VALGGKHVVGGIEPNPAELRQERFGPGVGRPFGRPVVAFGAGREVAADVPARDTDAARERDHDVREILAHATTRPERIVDR
jgi:hypothetical protein